MSGQIRKKKKTAKKTHKNPLISLRGLILAAV
jgi:hypothetical protein